MTSHREIKKLVDASYSKNKDINDIGDLQLDRQLSTNENKVFHDSKTGKTIVANRGTQGTVKDWKNNLEYVKGNYSKTKRQKNAVKTQKKAIEKYGRVDKNVGHSQGAKVARVMNDKKLTGEVIQVNPATKNEKSNKKKNVHTIKSTGDVVSVLHKNNKNTTNVKTGSWNPLYNHSTSVLDYTPNKLVGSGHSFFIE